MVHDYLLLIVGLLLAVLLLVMVGQKLKISYPIFLVIAGLLLSFIPGILHIRIDPELVFLIFFNPNTIRSSLVHFLEGFLEMETTD